MLLLEGKEVHSSVYWANGNVSVGETGAPLFSVGCGDSGISHCEHAGSWLGGALLKLVQGFSIPINLLHSWVALCKAPASLRLHGWGELGSVLMLF